MHSLVWFSCPEKPQLMLLSPALYSKSNCLFPWQSALHACNTKLWQLMKNTHTHKTKQKKTCYHMTCSHYGCNLLLLRVGIENKDKILSYQSKGITTSHKLILKLIITCHV